MFGYWQAQPHSNFVEIAQEAERLGFHSAWTAEAWGSDAFTPLTWIGAHTTRLKLGTSIVQLSARTPTSTAMHALTLDHLSQGRLVLGLGVSGPQVVEGWYGRPFGKPLARAREYVDIVRQVMRREHPVENDGPHYPLPYFCDPSSPWQRGTNENTNRLLRQYFPKGTNLSGYSQAELNRTALELNQRPRKTLAFHCPAEALNDNVALTG
jgi:alkanesulfonate monooxygenase SsuD/methylene tetrahydromethanopterin reductase-like flavin-dependent oxidoreductase (luciferase family)